MVKQSQLTKKSYFSGHRLTEEEPYYIKWVSNRNWNGSEQTRDLQGLNPQSREECTKVGYNEFQSALEILKRSGLRLLSEGEPFFYDLRYISKEGVEITYTIPHTLGDKALEAITLRSASLINLLSFARSLKLPRI